MINNNKKELKMKVNNNEKTKYYTYEYEGVWSIYDEETREHKRDETIPFDVICEYTPKVWDKMEDDYDDEFSEIISECYSEVMVDFDDETEYHEGNEDYWRVKCIG
jgi:hypothetical protein